MLSTLALYIMKKFVASVSWSKDKTGYMREYSRYYRNKFPKKFSENKLRFYKTRKHLRDFTRLDVLSHYSGGNPKCACCGENEINFLAIDHINGGGRKHLKKLGMSSLHPSWFVKNDFPKDFQILCHNCNWGKHKCGQCPHLSRIKV